MWPEFLLGNWREGSLGKKMVAYPAVQRSKDACFHLSSWNKVPKTGLRGNTNLYFTNLYFTIVLRFFIAMMKCHIQKQLREESLLTYTSESLFIMEGS